MTSSDLHEDVNRIRDTAHDLEVSTTRKLGEIETKLSGAKHDVAGVKQMVISLEGRIDRFENQIKTEFRELGVSMDRQLRELGKQLSEDVSTLSREINKNNTRSVQKFSFYAGIAATGTFIISASGILIALATRFLPGHN